MSVVLVLGSGGREHALAVALAASPAVSSVLVAPGNAGTHITPNVTNISLNFKDHQAVIEACRQKNVSVVVVGPEDPLADGLANSLTTAGIKVFGPTKEAAQIESSKAWAKDFMVRHEVPTAAYRTFTDAQKAKDFIKTETWAGYVVKASGLAAGKGVVVTDSCIAAIEAVDTVCKNFGAAGETIIIEELLGGEEISVLCFTDGNTVTVMPPAQDHKRLQEGDQGPNTGGMGAYCPCPLVSQQELQTIKETILVKTVSGLRKEGIPFVGVLYAGLMITSSGPKVLEFNCRFGDPETQVLLPLLLSDFYDIILGCVEGRLSEVPVKFDEKNTCVAVCLVSGGYPGSYPKGKPITGLSDVCEEAGVQVYHAGTKLDGKRLVTSGGRVLAVAVTDPSLVTAVAKATMTASRVMFDGVFFRRDIAAKAIARYAVGQGGVTYRDSGVDIVAGEAVVSAIKDVAATTTRSGVMGSLGSFGGLFDLQAAGYSEPILVSGTDGVGTKLKVAQAACIHNTVGQDLVAMCVNDVLVHGAEPLFFLDYFATGHLEVGVAASVIKGVADGCLLAGCALIGGETAEMPGLYSPGEYDLAGFTVGAVEKSGLLPRKSEIVAGDVVLGLASSGLHSNGFSLVRKIVEASNLKYTDPAPFSPSKTLGSELLTPTRIYSKAVMAALHSGLVKAAAHITGGGLMENLPRVLPNNLTATLQATKWHIHPVFHWLAAHGVSSSEMARTFNCGVGLVLVVGAGEVTQVTQLISDNQVFVIGTLKTRLEGSPQVVIEKLDYVFGTGAASILPLCPLLTTPHRKVAVLISGSGTNLQALLDHTRSGLSAAKIVLVISNVPDVKGLQRAKDAGVTTEVIPHKNYKNRQEFDAALTVALRKVETELICLAGFMRILTGDFVKTWRGKLLNIHPSLLPSFKGMHAQRQALQAGVTLTGCTVHFVAEEVDGGAIVTQEAVPVLPGDTEDILAERIKTAEHKAFPRAMEMVARGQVVLGDDGCCSR
ncbi:trifunctional purine biosynthetic protein adenosine-3-like isoform X2 [Homarus americanus]|uniref:trifunctional purine biosynthetic protein adenosine-3-like isoform X2 n=1 Tax=Homarus americanus TaxID=6706 RepID=UPI001C45D07B|nr:trifunctional purine biosynthetic protein adenosine-3-like isoform X2 [Homarus americanus]